MGRPHPIELRERVVALVEEGCTHRAAARHFRVSVKLVNDMVRLKRQTGSLVAKRQGNPGWSRVGPHEGWVRTRLAEKADLTLEALVRQLGAQRRPRVAVSAVGYWLHRLGLTHNKRPARG
jgi:transposase